jgi:hypothetical protein
VILLSTEKDKHLERTTGGLSGEESHFPDSGIRVPKICPNIIFAS